MVFSDCIRTFDLGSGVSGRYFSLPALADAGFPQIKKLPVSLRVVLESVARHCDGTRILREDVEALAAWQPQEDRKSEIPFVLARIVLQDFTGVPLLVDLAAMRAAVAKLNKDPKLIEPLVPVDLVVDHSVQVDFAGSAEALKLNLQIEFQRNRERYEFLKWGMQAFDTFKVVPPGIGIVHQVNLEYLAKGVWEKDGLYYPDTLVGTDSHTTMINGLGVVGWGVGGIEAEAGMLGQPVYFLTPDVVGVHLTGKLREGATATDLALTLTSILRQAKVVGKFVEFYGEGAAALPVVDRATIANMAPEYGATMGFFPVDHECVRYLAGTGRSTEWCRTFENYYRAQEMFGMPKPGDIEYSANLELDLGTVQPSVAGPKRPQDRINLPDLKSTFEDLFVKPIAESGYAKDASDLSKTFGVNGHSIAHGGVLIAAITSCTNTSNPSVMLAAGLVAKRAVERGLNVPSGVKTSLAPGSRVVTDYLQKTGLQPYLDKLGFHLVGYGCTTCIGNSGPLDPEIEKTITDHDVIAASVLSGNRNFEARVHQAIKANFLMSPPLVVAFALAGRVNIDLVKEPIGKDQAGQDVYLKDLWPSLQEVREAMESAITPEVFQNLYRDFASQNPQWNEIPSSVGDVYSWNQNSTYIQQPPFFKEFDLEPTPPGSISNARALGIFGDSVTTDHISPAGAIKPSSPAGKFLQEHAVEVKDFNSYGSRRGNDLIMTRGTFANVRIKNLMAGGVEGGVTVHQPSSELMSIFDAAQKYAGEGVPLVILAGTEYGTGSSRDWAAKGTRLLGVRAVIAESFERIHRSNLVGMGVLPLQFADGVSVKSLGLDGSEHYGVKGLHDPIQPQQRATLVITKSGGERIDVPVLVRIDTPIEVDYYKHGGILPFVLRQILQSA
ncbi:MAG: aconitate hydratase AcnA [Verrucomicrobiales bacterium]